MNYWSKFDGFTIDHFNMPSRDAQMSFSLVELSQRRPYIQLQMRSSFIVNKPALVEPLKKIFKL